jgi:protein ImuB
MMERRIVSIWFPELAMNRWTRAHANTDEARSCDSQPFALVSEATHGTILDAVNSAARAAGTKAGQKLTDARAICPALAVAAGDREADTAALGRLALWSRRWCPWTATDGHDALLLDTTGGAHLFGGEAPMLKDMQARFATLGLATRIALAPTIGAAWALSHFSADHAPVRCPQEGMATALTALPIESLRLDGAAALLLRRLGLKTVGALAAVPRMSLARRFRKADTLAANPLVRLDQAMGRSEEMVAPIDVLPRERATKRVADPVLHISILEPILAELAARLCLGLEKRQRGLRRVRFEAFRVDGELARREAETAQPVRDPVHIVRLFDEQLETLDAGFGFDSFALTALVDEPTDVQQPGLDEEVREGIPLAHLIDRLCVRIGARNVRQPVACASHIPERAVGWRPALDGPPEEGDVPDIGERPLRLLDRPEPITVIYATPEGPPRRFRWRRCLHDVVRVEGPERIAPEWWRERSTARLRDYYKIEDETGQRFWIYRSGLIDDGRGGPPDWFLHGLFA